MDDYIVDDEDIEGSCLWVAAWLGSAWGRLLLTLRLVEVRSDMEIIHEAAAPLPMAGVRPDEVLEAFNVLDSLNGYAEFRKYQRHAHQGERSRSDAPAPSVPGGESMRVLVSEPVTTSRDDKALVEHYSALRQPVKLLPHPPPDKAAEALLDQFPWFTDLIESVRNELTLAGALGRTHAYLRPILIHGPSGVGKTRFAERLAAQLGVPTGRIVAAGATDNRRLAGTARGWSSTQPCLPLIVMRQHLVANPLIIVDEIDKAGTGGRNGRLVDTLLSMLDPETARHWPDECVLADVDLSAITWVLICNHLHRVPAALRARCQVVRVERPRPEHFETILRASLEDISGEHGIDVRLLPRLDPTVLESLRSGFRNGRLQPRQLAALLRRSLAVAATAEMQVAAH